MLKYLLLIFMFFSCWEAKSQEVISQADNLISQKKYLSAFQLLNSEDPDEEDVEIFLKKTEIALQYFARSIMHQMFAFKDLEENESILELRAKSSEQKLTMHLFDIERTGSYLFKKSGDQRVNKCLGDYYYEVHLKYGANWIKPESEVLQNMHDHYKLATDSGISDYLTWYCIGYYHTLQGSLNMAIPAYKESIALNDTFPTPHYNLAISYIHNDSLDESLPYALKAIDLYKDKELKADAARISAMLYRSKGDYSNALKYYKLCNNIEPGNYHTLKQMLEFQVLRNDLEAALVTSEEFLKLDPANRSLYQDMLIIYNGKEENLIKFLEKQAKEYKNLDEVMGNIYFHLGELYSYKENEKLSEKNFLKAQKHYSDIFPANHVLHLIIKERLAKSK